MPGTAPVRWAVSASFIVMTLAVGGSLFEHLVVDPAWPAHIELIQPQRGARGPQGLLDPDSRRDHHPASPGIVVVLAKPVARRWVLVAIGSYLAMRIWSAVYFIPAALRFEAVREATPALVEEARRWVLWSPVRRLLAVAASAALWIADRRAQGPVR